LPVKALIGQGHRFTTSNERRNLSKIEDSYLTVEEQKVEIIFDPLHQFRNSCKQMLSIKGVLGVNKSWS
jgi:hypothetical protein